MQVEFTKFAKGELQKMYDYYAEAASDDIALKVIDKILDEAENLERLPNIGSKEFLLEELKRNHRYLVCGNYKIVFYKTEAMIYVTDVFDCRQNPQKMVERNK